MALSAIPSQGSPSQLQTPLSRLLAYICLLPHINDSLEGVLSMHASNAPDPVTGPSVPEFDQWFLRDSDIECELLVELVRPLQSHLSDDCEWLEDGEISLASDLPVAAGGVADVLVGTRGDQKVAIKRYRVYSSSDCLPTYMRFRKEILACSQFRHDNLVPFIGVSSTPQYPMCLVFEHMAHGNLSEYLGRNNQAGRCELLLDVSRAVEYLHTRDVVHKNIKSENIMIDCRGRARLGGHGAALLSSATPGIDIDRFFYGAAPELIEYRRFGLTDTGATKATDVFAFGVLAWEVFSGGFPFPDKPKVAGIVSMWKGRRPGRPNHRELSNRLWETIQRCWKVDPTRRMSISEVATNLEAEVKVRQLRSRAFLRGRI